MHGALDGPRTLHEFNQFNGEFSAVDNGVSDICCSDNAVFSSNNGRYLVSDTARKSHRLLPNF